MSQSASPIGSVEFIVKFETMQGSFIKAMKEAIKDADITIDGKADDSAKIDEILDNIRYRLRTPFSGDYEQFRSVGIPEIEFAKSEKAINDFASALRSKNMVIKTPEESQENYIKRSKDAAEVLFNHWISMIENSMKDESFFRKNQTKLVNLQGAIGQAMQGSWEYMVRTFVDQVLTETELEESIRKRLNEYGLAPAGNKRLWSRMETSLIKPGATTQIKSEKDLMKALSETTLTAEQIKEVIEWDPGEATKMAPDVKEQLMRILNKYFVDAWDVQIPNAILNVWKEGLMTADWLSEDFKIAKAGGKVHDVLNIIVKDQIENFTKFLKDFDVGEEQVEKIISSVEKQMDELGGWALLPWEGKIAGSIAKWFKKKLAGYDESLMLTFAGIGPTGGIGGISSTKLLENVETMSKEELKNFIMEERQKREQFQIIDILNRIAGDTDKIEFIKEKIEELETDPTKVLGSGQ